MVTAISTLVLQHPKPQGSFQGGIPQSNLTKYQNVEQNITNTKKGHSQHQNMTYQYSASVALQIVLTWPGLADILHLELIKINFK